MTLLSLFFLGAQRFLYKVAAEKGYSTTLTTMVFVSSVSLMSAVLLVFQRSAIVQPLFFIALSIVNGASFGAATIASIEALKRLPSNAALPLIRLNTALVVLFSIVYFGERLSVLQIAGIILAIGVIFLLMGFNGTESTVQGNLKGWLFAFIAFIAGAVAAISSKLASQIVEPLAFMALSYGVGTVMIVLLKNYLPQPSAHRSVRSSIALGFAMGVLNFVGFYAFMKALAQGPLSLVAPITGMHFVVAIVISAFVYREKLTAIRALGIALTVVSVVLMRL